MMVATNLLQIKMAWDTPYPIDKQDLSCMKIMMRQSRVRQGAAYKGSKSY
jgi:hypothetical protein